MSMQGALGTLSSPSVTTGMLERKIEEISSAGDLDEALKSKLTELYHKALSSLETARSYEARAIAYARALESAPEETKQIRAKLQTRSFDPEPTLLPPGLSIKEMEQQLAKEEANTAAVSAKLSEMEKELETWSKRPFETRERITEAKGELEALDEEVSLPIPREESQLVSEARRWDQQARQSGLRAELLMLDRELLSHAAREALLKAERDKSTLDLKMLRNQQAYLVEQIQERRHAEAREAQAEAEAARRDTAGKHSILQGLAQRNSTLTDDLSELTAKLDDIDEKRGEIIRETKRIADEFRNTRQRLEIAGLSQTLGQVLIDRRQKLPNQRVYRKEANKREAVIADANLRQIRYGEERSNLRDLEVFVDNLTTELEQPIPTQLRNELLELAEQRRDLLDKATEVDDAYLRMLGNLDYVSSQLMETVGRYDDYLAKRLLWVRNGPTVNLDTLRSLPPAIGWLISPRNWLEVVQVLAHEAITSPLVWLMILAVLLLGWKARAIRAEILVTALPLRRVSTDRIGYTLKAVGLSLLIALPWPLLLVTLGWQLAASLDATSFTKAVGSAALAVASALYGFRAFRLLCIPGGVADRHFRWSSAVLATIRRNFDWAIWVLIPIGFVASAAYGHENLTFAGSLGRVSLLAVMVGTAYLAARLLNRKTGVLRTYLSEHPQGWVSRLHPIWYPSVVAVPLALAVLALIGYVYTSGILLRSMFHELWLILVLTVIHQVMVRWLMLTRRRLALRAAIERHASSEQGDKHRESSGAGSMFQSEEPAADLASLDERTRKLVNSLLIAAALVGLWAVYSEALPALAVFDEISLWSYTGTVDGESVVVPVTLADIGLILIIAIVATVAVKNLPALLEILLLQRMSISAGSRYTIKTLTSYGIVATATLMIFGTLGWSWSQVQWLVAALGVGIGFGLQEIVANFISGLIILFERPIRVGDRVTIGETTGIVSNIQIRATTIRNWEKQELLVPNKELITGRLLNWSLSDELNRIVITVGVSFDADISQALRLLENAARENPRVLDDPEPLITFEGFGDNALSLVLRCYLDNLDKRLSVTSELHQSINEMYRAAGISIAFPQRDVHLSATEPLDVRLHHDSTC
jgi:potassium efflux system protein